MFAPQSRARLFITIAILLAATFAALTWRGMRDERTRVAFRTCFYAEDAARLLQAKTRLRLQAIAGHLGSQAHFRVDLDGRGTITHMEIDRAIAADSARIAEAVTRLKLRPRDAGLVVAASVQRTVGDTDVLGAIAILSPRPEGWDGHILSPTVFITEVIAPVFDSEPVFSSMLSTITARGVRFPLPPPPNGSLANFAIMDEHWATLYRTGAMSDTVMHHLRDPGSDDNYASPGCVGASPMDPAMASLVFLVSPTLPTYDQWIDNGLVASYAPSLGVILAAMLASMAAAILFARREAELARLRSDFVSNVSHELRMPLAQILLSGETLRLGRTRSQAERDCEADSIVREAHRLAGFVENVLSFSRIEHQNTKVTPQPIDLGRVVEETIATTHTLADARAVTVTSSVPRNLDAFVDPDGIRQVLFNLLENAIKYGPVGQQIIVGAEPSNTAVDRIEVWVDDEGPGVPWNAVTQIFEPFVRLDRDRSAGVSGSGLGLAVVRYIVEQHGGCVWIEPGGRGHGSRFVIEIPTTGSSR